MLRLPTTRKRIAANAVPSVEGTAYHGYERAGGYAH
jgi:hypothetical protein